MVGEIRDKEVAETAINAALTGHLVFSTLHTNNAAAAFPRLIDLGINPKIISSAINITLAQRLVRVLCPQCKKKAMLTKEQRGTVDRILAGIVVKENISENTSEAWEADPAGCATCNGLGYSGRIGIFEAIIMDEAIERLVKQSASEREIREGARPQGILTLEEDAILKLLRGITSFSELERVIDLEARL